MKRQMTAYCVVGYPGSGKSEATNIAEDLGYPTVTMGTCVKERAREVLGESASSDEIGEWATEQREKHGKDIVADWTLSKIEEDLIPEIKTVDGVETVPPSRVKPERKLFIDGLRSFEALERFEEEFNDVKLVYVSAPRWLRLLRLKDRGRDGEDSFTLQRLKERDEREDNWGVGEILEKRPFVEVENKDSLGIYREKVREVLR